MSVETPVHPGWRAAFAALAIVLAVVVELAVLTRLSLPGATPDLVTVTVVSLALAAGPAFGALSGFAAGLALDLAPPGDTQAGRWVLVLALIGYGAGLARRDADRPGVVPLGLATAGAGAAAVLHAAVGAILGDPRVQWPVVGRLLPTVLLYALVLSPFVVPAVSAVARRLGPDADPT